MIMIVANDFYIHVKNKIKKKVIKQITNFNFQKFLYFYISMLFDLIL